MRTFISFTVALLTLSPALVWAQTKTSEADKLAKGVRFEPLKTQRFQVGVIIKAVGGACHGIHATVPVPAEWPEQQVKSVAEDVSPTVQSHREREVAGTVRQMVIEIPNLPAGQVAKCLVTYEVTRSAILPPENTDIFSIPAKPDRALAAYVGPSPYIESGDPKITALAKELTAGKKQDWQKAQAIYQFARDTVKSGTGPIKGAVPALTEKTGGCDDINCLFIAICRAAKIPARTVWVDKHCYSEIHLVDDDGKGHWFPCEGPSAKTLGGISDARPILQKGDNFKDPDRPREKLRYMSEFIKGTGGGAGKPEVQFIRKAVSG